jgi:DNA-binding transcriptional MocR family regulator
VAQLAVASLLADGTVARLAHRRARAYAAKRHIVRTTLAPLTDDVANGVRIAGRDAVDTAVLYLPDGSDVDAVVEDVAERGVRVETLAPYHFSARPAPPAPVVGYGHPSDAELRRACVRLRAALIS